MRAVVQRVLSASVEVLNMRLFPNEKTGKAWDQSVMQRKFDVLLVSQFTLYGILKGNSQIFMWLCLLQKQSHSMLLWLRNFRGYTQLAQ
ncbi:hypothetical protein PR202_ga24292 [Eleusine coracana subsp. coracana]|uniref:D-aminoacyl-tRNA deacylase n=1 Tax=Eleusine coracana subsp. coracana TaxID=191504 RepID=A0AAV5D6I7_ELECO|nr:hypothetical protein PR202_ga24292 [Eleusine coracana subsp. coracana]